MKISNKTLWIITILGLIAVFPVGIAGLCVLAYRYWNEHQSTQDTQKEDDMRHQREIELKEIDMVRKANEILIHLIQDEHRKEDC